MRRRLAIGAAAIVLAGGVTIGSAWAVTSGAMVSAPTPAPAPADVDTSASAAKAQRIANSLADPAARARYRLPDGVTLISATICVRSSCVTRQFAEPPACPPAPEACIGTALVTRHFRHGLTITVELA